MKFVLLMAIGVLGILFHGKNESVIRFSPTRTVFPKINFMMFFIYITLTYMIYLKLPLSTYYINSIFVFISEEDVLTFGDTY